MIELIYAFNEREINVALSTASQFKIDELFLSKYACKAHVLNPKDDSYTICPTFGDAICHLSMDLRYETAYQTVILGIQAGLSVDTESYSITRTEKLDTESFIVRNARPEFYDIFMLREQARMAPKRFLQCFLSQSHSRDSVCCSGNQGQIVSIAELCIMPQKTMEQRSKR